MGPWRDALLEYVDRAIIVYVDRAVIVRLASAADDGTSMECREIPFLQARGPNLDFLTSLLHIEFSLLTSGLPARAIVPRGAQATQAGSHSLLRRRRPPGSDARAAARTARHSSHDSTLAGSERDGRHNAGRFIPEVRVGEYTGICDSVGAQEDMTGTRIGPLLESPLDMVF